MPPKKKRTTKKKQQKGGDDGKSSMLNETEELKSRLGDEQKQRNYFQIENDILEGVSEELKNARNKEKKLESEILLLQKNYFDNLKKYTKEMVTGEITAEAKRNEFQIEILEQMKKEKDALSLAEEETRIEARDSKTQLKENYIEFQEVIRNINRDHEKIVTELQEEANSGRVHRKYEKMMKVLKDDLILSQKTATLENEELRNQHLNSLMLKFRESFDKLKQSHDKSMREEDEIVEKLQVEISALQRSLAGHERKVKRLEKENLQKNEQLTSLEEENAKLNQEVKNRERDRSTLDSTTSRLFVCKKALDKSNYQKEILTQKVQELDLRIRELQKKNLRDCEESLLRESVEVFSEKRDQNSDVHSETRNVTPMEA